MSPGGAQVRLALQYLIPPKSVSAPGEGAFQQAALSVAWYEPHAVFGLVHHGLLVWHGGICISHLPQGWWLTPSDHCRGQEDFFLSAFFFFNILFIHERHREAETEAEGEAGSLWGAQYGTPGTPGSRPEPKADTHPLSHLGGVPRFFLKDYTVDILSFWALGLCCNLALLSWLGSGHRLSVKTGSSRVSVTLHLGK